MAGAAGPAAQGRDQAPSPGPWGQGPAPPRGLGPRGTPLAPRHGCEADGPTRHRLQVLANAGPAGPDVSRQAWPRMQHVEARGTPMPRQRRTAAASVLPTGPTRVDHSGNRSRAERPGMRRPATYSGSLSGLMVVSK